MEVLEPPRKKAKILHTPSIAANFTRPSPSPFSSASTSTTTATATATATCLNLTANTNRNRNQNQNAAVTPTRPSTFKLPTTTVLRSPGSLVFKARNDLGKSAFGDSSGTRDGKENIREGATGSPASNTMKRIGLPFPIANSPTSTSSSNGSGATTPLRRPGQDHGRGQQQQQTSSKKANQNANATAITITTSAAYTKLHNTFLPPASPSPKPNSRSTPRERRILQPPPLPSAWGTPTKPPPKLVHLPPPSPSSVPRPAGGGGDATPKKELVDLSAPPGYVRVGAAYTPSSSTTSAATPNAINSNTTHPLQIPPLPKAEQLTELEAYTRKEVNRGLQISPKKRDVSLGWGGRVGKFVRNGLAERFSNTITNEDTKYMFWRKEMEIQVQRERERERSPAINGRGVVDSLKMRAIGVGVGGCEGVVKERGKEEKDERRLRKKIKIPPEEVRVRIEEIVHSFSSSTASSSAQRGTMNVPGFTGSTSSSASQGKMHARTHSVLARCSLITSQRDRDKWKSEEQEGYAEEDGGEEEEEEEELYVIFRALPPEAAYVTLPVELAESVLASRRSSTARRTTTKVEGEEGADDPSLMIKESRAGAESLPAQETADDDAHQSEVEVDTDMAGTKDNHGLTSANANANPDAPEDTSKTNDPHTSNTSDGAANGFGTSTVAAVNVLTSTESESELAPKPSPPSRTPTRTKTKTKMRLKLSSVEHLSIGAEVMIWKPFCVTGSGPGSADDRGMEEMENLGAGMVVDGPLPEELVSIQGDESGKTTDEEMQQTTAGSLMTEGIAEIEAAITTTVVKKTENLDKRKKMIYCTRFLVLPFDSGV